MDQSKTMDNDEEKMRYLLLSEKDLKSFIEDECSKSFASSSANPPPSIHEKLYLDFLEQKRKREQRAHLKEGEE